MSLLTLAVICYVQLAEPIPIVDGAVHLQRISCTNFTPRQALAFADIVGVYQVSAARHDNPADANSEVSSDQERCRGWKMRTLTEIDVIKQDPDASTSEAARPRTYCCDSDALREGKYLIFLRKTALDRVSVIGTLPAIRFETEDMAYCPWEWATHFADTWGPPLLDEARAAIACKEPGIKVACSKVVERLRSMMPLDQTEDVELKVTEPLLPPFVVHGSVDGPVLLLWVSGSPGPGWIEGLSGFQVPMRIECDEATSLRTTIDSIRIRGTVLGKWRGGSFWLRHVGPAPGDGLSE